MKQKLIENELYSHFNNQMLFEVKDVYTHSSVIFTYPEKSSANYSVITKPYLLDGHLCWRSKYDNYTYSQAKAYAKEIDNMYTKVENLRTVTDTAKDIEKNINDSMFELYHYDLQKAYDKSAEKHSEFDIALTVALTIHEKQWDGRFSEMNKTWADSFINANNVNAEDFSQRFYGCNTHPALLDGFTNVIRKNIANRTMQQLQGVGEELSETEQITHGRTR